MTQQLPQFLRELIASPPHAGEGVHAWLFRVARQLHAHLPAVQIVALLEERVRGCGRHVPRSEIEEAVKNSLTCAWQPSRGAGQTSVPSSAAKWPPVNNDKCAAIISDGVGLADLWELSPVRIEDSESHTEEIVDRLFPGNPLLCCGRSNCDFNTQLREQWRGKLSGLQFITPSPMIAETGITKGGKESAHALNNTGPRRFLICEFDQGRTHDEQAALLIHLAGFAPMVCALHSGGKSLHGWFFVHGQTDTRVLKFFQYAVSLGADPATWTRSQFVRMPDGVRDNGKRQTVYFLNYRPIEIYAQRSV